MNKLLAIALFTFSLVAFIPLLLISVLGDRDIQLEITEKCLKFWKNS